MGCRNALRFPTYIFGHANLPRIHPLDASRTVQNLKPNISDRNFVTAPRPYPGGPQRGGPYPGGPRPRPNSPARYRAFNP